MSDAPAWMTGKAKKKRQNARSAAQERSRAEEVGGRTTAGSGSSWRAAGDVRNPGSEGEDDYLEELKYTAAQSYSLKIKTFEDIRHKASLQGADARLVIEFQDDEGNRLLRLIVEEG